MVGLMALILGAGCRQGVPAPDTVPQAPQGQALISGTVRGTEGVLPVAGRTLAIIDVATGQQRTVRTGSSGGFSVAVPAGRYRLEMSLRDGEKLIKRPDVVDLDRADTDANIEFVLGTGRMVRPRGPAYRLDNGLGSPIA
jgi:hypothetical protein